MHGQALCLEGEFSHPDPAREGEWTQEDARCGREPAQTQCACSSCGRLVGVVPGLLVIFACEVLKFRVQARALSVAFSACEPKVAEQWCDVQITER